MSRATHIGDGCVLGKGCVIEGNAVLERTIVGRDCVVGAGAVIIESHLWAGEDLTRILRTCSEGSRQLSVLRS